MSERPTLAGHQFPQAAASLDFHTHGAFVNMIRAVNEAPDRTQHAAYVAEAVRMVFRKELTATTRSLAVKPQDKPKAVLDKLMTWKMDPAKLEQYDAAIKALPPSGYSTTARLVFDEFRPLMEAVRPAREIAQPAVASLAAQPQIEPPRTFGQNMRPTMISFMPGMMARYIQRQRDAEIVRDLARHPAVAGDAFIEALNVAKTLRTASRGRGLDPEIITTLEETAARITTAAGDRDADRVSEEIAEIGGALADMDDALPVATRTSIIKAVDNWRVASSAPSVEREVEMEHRSASRPRHDVGGIEIGY